MQNLSYLKVPRHVNFNLNLGDDKYFEKPAEEEKIRHLLTFIMRNCDKVVRNERVNADFVCFRGLLRQIMVAPYEWREPWIVLACKHKGTIYLCAEETQEKKNKKMAETARDKKFQRYGHKFEKYLFSKSPQSEPPGSEGAVIESEEFCVMFSTRLGKNTILYGAEIDGVQSNAEITTLEQLRAVPLVEAKVKRRESNERQMQNFYRFKARNFWCQSFLVGIDRVAVGLRDDDGFVDEVTSMSLKDLSNEAKINDFWHATVCVNFLNDFLEKVRLDMSNVGDSREPSVVFKYEWNSNTANFVTCRHLSDKKFEFVTQDFVAFMSRLV
jgi:RAT1-interacting protein